MDATGEPPQSSALDDASERPDWSTVADFLRFWLENNPLAGEDRAVFERYYRNYRRSFSPYIQHHVAGQSREVLELIRRRPSPRLLDVGAGCGTEALWFALHGAQVTAIDIQTARLETARARCEWLGRQRSRPVPAEFIETSLFDLDPARPFDIIWMEQTFHHLEPRADVYGTLFRLLRPGGTLVISEVNGWNVPLQLQLFLRRGFKTRKTFIDSRGRSLQYGNERVTTPGALRRGLERAGFHRTSIRPFRLLPNSNPPRGWLPIERALVGALPFLSTHFNLVADKPA
jgi:2-polyprenyl-3-methyl-5-hydroxy-6-metoxy-1,4-benzoquinol methylase